MAQIKNPLDEVRIPFAKMTYTPDVPSTALQPNEYNSGYNVETDVRGIRAIAGDEEILDTVPGIPTFVTGGFRQNNTFWFIVASYEVDPMDPTNPDANIGRWWASDGTTTWYDITPGGVPILGYRQNTNITESWNGTVPLFNDTRTAPMFWPEATALNPSPIMTQYSNNIIPEGIFDIVYVNPTTMQIILDNAYATAPYTAGQQIVISGINNYFNGVFTVVSSTTTTIDYLAVPGASYPGGSVGSVAPAYTWNYNPNWSKLIANFMRMYSTPNVGSILVAGDLTVNPAASFIGDTTSGSNTILATSATTDWIDAIVFSSDFASGTTITAVTPGVDVTVSTNSTGTNAGLTINLQLATIERYPVTVQWSQAFGLNQAPRTWEPTIINVANQLEVPLRGEALDAFPCNGQFFLCSYWDTVVFSPINYSTTSAPILGIRQFNQGRGLLSSNCWANTDKLVYGIDARDVWVFDGQDFQGLGNQRVKNWLFDKLDPQYYDRVFMEVNSQRSQVEIYYPDRSTALDGVPNKMLSYRYDLDCWNAPRDVSDATFSCEAPIFEFNNPNYDPLLSSRTVVYARGIEDGTLVQKDQGYEFINGAPISSQFRRDNIKLLKDYSGKLMVHRILPEVVNLGAVEGTDNELPVDPATSTHKGNVTVTIKGANSVGSAPSSSIGVTIPVDGNGIAGANPWAQINQNAFRVNTIELSNTSNNDIWMCSATTWQVTQVEDDR
jgi:hypothetical protein